MRHEAVWHEWAWRGSEEDGRVTRRSVRVEILVLEVVFLFDVVHLDIVLVLLVDVVDDVIVEAVFFGRGFLALIEDALNGEPFGLTLRPLVS